MVNNPHPRTAATDLNIAPNQSVASGLIAFQRVETAPIMHRVNGIGTILLGRLSDPAISPARVKLLWLTLLFVPILPLRAYAVEGTVEGYRFYGEMGLWPFLKRYRWRVIAYLFTVLLEAALRAVFVISIALLIILPIAWLLGILRS